MFLIQLPETGEKRDPDRAFGFFMMGVLLYGASGLWIMPRLLDLATEQVDYVTIASNAKSPAVSRAGLSAC